MSFNTKQFGIVLKNARLDRKLTQSELAEELNISLSYLKDLEGFRNTPSLDMFEKIVRYFNISADSVIYPESEAKNDSCAQLQRLLTRCDDAQLRVLLATAKALLAESDDSAARG